MSTVREDPVLGALVFDTRLNWYESTQETSGGERLKLMVSIDTPEDEELSISNARALLPALLAAIENGKEFASEKLLKLKNESWLEAGEAPLSTSQFISALEIESIVVFSQQLTEFYFKDGELFWGHTVLLSWDPVRGFYDGNIAG